MTATLEPTGHSDTPRYPERITIRVSDPVYPIYQAMDEAYNVDNISQSNRIWALLDLFWAHGTPEQRDAVRQRARELGHDVHMDANSRRSVRRALAHAQRRSREEDT